MKKNIIVSVLLLSFFCINFVSANPTCGENITSSVTFDGDLNCTTQYGLIVGADNIVIDGAGYTMIAGINDTALHNIIGIDIGIYNNITIKNITILVHNNVTTSASHYSISIKRSNNLIINNTNLGLFGGFSSSIFNYGISHIGAAGDYCENWTINNVYIKDVSKGIFIRNINDANFTNIQILGVNSNGFEIDSFTTFLPFADNIYISNLTSTGQGTFSRGMQVDGLTNSIFENLNLSGNYHGFYTDDYATINFTMKDSILSGETYDLFYGYDSSGYYSGYADFLNVTYDVETVQTNKFMTRQWYLDANVTYQNGTVVEGANISIYNSTNYLIYTQLTDSNGKINQQSLDEYDNLAGSKTYYTPYFVNMSFGEYPDDGEIVNLTINKEIGFVLGGAEDTTPPYFISIPSNATIQRNESLGVDFDATDETSFDTFSVNDTTNFQINSTGYLSNKTSLSVGTYELNITINDTSNNINWTNYKVTVTSLSFSESTSDTISSSSSLSKLSNLNRQDTNSITSGTFIENLLDLFRNTEESITTQTEATRQNNFIKTTTTIITSQSQVNKLINSFRNIYQNIYITDSDEKDLSLSRSILSIINSNSFLDSIRTISRSLNIGINYQDEITTQKSLFRIFSESIGITDIINILKELFRNTENNINIEDIITKQSSKTRNTTELISTSDEITSQKSLFREFLDSIQVTDSTSRLRNLINSISQLITISDQETRELNLSRNITQKVNYSDLDISQKNLLRYLSDEINFGDSNSRLLILTRQVEDLISIDDLISRLLDLNRNIEESTNINDSLSSTKGLNRETSESILVNIDISRNQNINRVISNLINSNTIISRTYYGFRTIDYEIVYNDGATRTKTFIRTISQAISINDLVNRMNLLNRLVNYFINIGEGGIWGINYLYDESGNLDENETSTTTTTSSGGSGGFRQSIQNIIQGQIGDEEKILIISALGILLFLILLAFTLTWDKMRKKKVIKLSFELWLIFGLLALFVGLTFLVNYLINIA